MWQKKIHLIGLTEKMILVERDRTRKRFNALRDYLACIEYIRQHVTNGGFELLEEESTCPLNQVKTEDGCADEIMVHMIRCKHCGQVFICVVNTYRVSGSFKKGKGCK